MKSSWLRCGSQPFRGLNRCETNLRREALVKRGGPMHTLAAPITVRPCTQPAASSRASWAALRLNRALQLNSASLVPVVSGRHRYIVRSVVPWLRYQPWCALLTVDPCLLFVRVLQCLQKQAWPQVNIPKAKRAYCKGKQCLKHTVHKVTQYKTGKASLYAQGVASDPLMRSWALASCAQRCGQNTQSSWSGHRGLGYEASVHRNQHRKSSCILSRL